MLGPQRDRQVAEPPFEIPVRAPADNRDAKPTTRGERLEQGYYFGVGRRQLRRPCHGHECAVIIDEQVNVYRLTTVGSAYGRTIRDLVVGSQSLTSPENYDDPGNFELTMTSLPAEDETEGGCQPRPQYTADCCRLRSGRQVRICRFLPELIAFHPISHHSRRTGPRERLRNMGAISDDLLSPPRRVKPRDIGAQSPHSR